MCEFNDFSNSFTLVLEMSVYTPCPEKKGATDFFAVTFTNVDGFS